VVDIHSHILHGLDDGATSFEQSQAMVRLAQETGTTDIVATPHSNSTYPYDHALRDQRVAELQDAAGAGLRIHRGCDFHLSAQNLQWVEKHPSHFSINGLRYLLVEFPDVSWIQGVDQIFAVLKSVGLTPIVTHPERNIHLAHDVARLKRWVDQGLYLQLTAQSVVGELGLEVARWCGQVLKMGLVHFVASDGHDTVERPPRLDHAKQFLTQEFGEEYAEMLLEINPRAVIEGRPLDVGPQVPQSKKAHRRFHFWL
jgi:protein-tyrosine phosphatase